MTQFSAAYLFVLTLFAVIYIAVWLFFVLDALRSALHV